MLLKCLRFCVLFMLMSHVANAVSGKLDNLTKRQRSRIRHKFKENEEKNSTLFDRKTKYLFDIIHGRPENLELDTDTCVARTFKMPNFWAPGRRISEVKCLEYIWRMRFSDEALVNMVKCGTKFDLQLINLNFGGYDAIPGEFPHLGALGWPSLTDTWLFMCAGALISEKFVLTSAHCYSLPTPDSRSASPYPVIVRFGEIDISDVSSVGKAPLDIEIQRFIKHPHYRFSRNYYDIALVELKKDVPFSIKNHPSCLWTNQFDDMLGTAKLTGWNIIESNYTIEKKEFASAAFDDFTRLSLLNKISPIEEADEESPDNPVLQVTDVDLMPINECEFKLMYKRHNRKWNGLVYHQFCVNESLTGNPKCRKYVGNVLQVPLEIPEYTDWKIHYIIGVKGFDVACDYPSIYTKVALFIDWIEDVVWGEQKYKKVLGNIEEH